MDKTVFIEKITMLKEVAKNDASKLALIAISSNDTEDMIKAKVAIAKMETFETCLTFARHLNVSADDGEPKPSGEHVGSFSLGG